MIELQKRLLEPITKTLQEAKDNTEHIEDHTYRQAKKAYDTIQEIKEIMESMSTFTDPEVVSLLEAIERDIEYIEDKLTSIFIL